MHLCWKNPSPICIFLYFQQVLSLEFGKHRDIVSKVRHHLICKVQEHPLDFTSLPVQIARLTVEIRNHQAAIVELHER